MPTWQLVTTDSGGEGVEGVARPHPL